MKTIIEPKYECEFCKSRFNSEKECMACENRKVTQDKGVKAGDKVRVLSGDGAGEIATVMRTFVADKYWGYVHWEKYWHTIVLMVELKVGHRILGFDKYETV